MPETPLTVFVVGLDDFHLGQLQTLPRASDYRFEPLFRTEELKRQDRFPVAEILGEGVVRLKEFPGGVDAIVGYWDFPVSTTLPLLRQAVDLPTTSLESVLKCEHKYWSRLVQKEVIPRHIPPFAALNPFASDPLVDLHIAFPFWMKPVKSVLSHLGFRIDDEGDFRQAIEKIRSGIGRYAVPFNMILERANLPPEVEGVDGFHCIAEGIISSGHQCTVEGYSWNGDVRVYGVVDSLREGATRTSFLRYQYPSNLPPEVVGRMETICRQLMRHIEYINSPFNAEFFWDEKSDQVWLLEVNTRISKSHAPLFYMVDGCYHHKVMLDLALQRKPDFPRHQGKYECAAKYMLRRYQDEIVTRVPSFEEKLKLEGMFEGVTIEILVDEGQRLSSLRDQDSYSYEVAVMFIGGDSGAELQSKYERIVNNLPLEFAPIGDPETTGYPGG